MKTFKRNAVIVTVLLFVCIAAYLNWSYSKNSGNSQTAAEVSPQNTASSAENKAAAASDAGLYYTTGASSANSGYFNTARLNRQQARDAAAETLAKVSKTAGASKEMVDAALKDISKIASINVKEAQLEDMIKAKGFSECVVYISDEGVNVTVPAPKEGLSAASAAKITDIITSETDFKATDLHIVEVK